MRLSARRRWDLVEEECLPKKQALIPTRNPLQSCGCMWACSSAGRAPALQESRQNHTSAASGVAYAEARGATNLVNWTDVGPKLTRPASNPIRSSFQAS